MPPPPFSLSSLLLLLLLIAGGAARADSMAAGFDSANKLYDAGKFTEAATEFEKLTVSGQSSAALYFNLGNAFFKSGRIGRAIAAYRQAERLAPRDPDVQANLQFARNQVQGPVLAPSRWQRWLAKLTLNEWALLAATAVWLWFILLALLQWRPGLKPALRNYVIFTGVAGALLCAGLGCAFSETRPARMAVVIARDVPVRGGPLDEAKTAFTLQDGAEVRVLDQKDDWLQVTTDPRRIGWLRRNQVLLN